MKLANTGEHRIVETRFATRIFQAIGVAALVTELERVRRHFRKMDRGELSVVEDGLQPGRARHAHMIVGPRNDELVRLQVLVIDHLPGLGALHPEIVRHVLLAKDVPDFGSYDTVDPVH